MSARSLTSAALLALLPLFLATPATAQTSHSAGQCGKSLTGTELSLPAFSASTQKRLDEDIAIAQAALRIAPDREESHFWLGRRLGYAGRICEAIDVFSKGLEVFPDSYTLRRYRARHLARARQFDLALTDYRDALALMDSGPDYFEPDGLPNKVGLTIGTYRSNIIYYHAQTSFATGDYRTVIDGMAKALALAPEFARDDMRVPTAYWTYLAYRKMGEHDKARAVIDAIEPGLKLIENDIYYQALQVMQGRLTAADLEGTADSTIKFAIAMEHRFSGEEAAAKAMLSEIIDENAQGHWPSEVELAEPERAAS